MQKILVVDDRSQFPQVGIESTDWIEYHTVLPSPSEFNFEPYAAVFAHERNKASEWAQEALEQERIDALFVFSGDEERVDNLGPLFTLPRSVFEDHFRTFLRRYSDGASTLDSAEVFTVAGEQDSASKASKNDLSLEVGDLGTIDFFVEEHGPSQRSGEHQSFPIRRLRRDTSRKIDHSATLRPLQEISEPHLVLLEEDYLSEGDGLDLLLHLRFEASHPFSRFPVVVHLRRPLEAWIRQHPRYSILATKGISLSNPRGSIDVNDGNSLKPLPPPQHLKILERLPLSPENLTGRHDLANEWGPIQLHQGLRWMWQDDPGLPDWAKESAKKLTQKLYYKHLFALISLRAKQKQSSTSSSLEEVVKQAKSAHKKWLGQIEDRSDTFRILLVDDEADKGWTEAIRELFRENTQGGLVRAITDAGEFDQSTESLADQLSSDEWDLALVDLRLTQEDQRLGSRDVEELTGTRLIHRLKRTCPERPVVAVTASNKAWTAKALNDVGADGYWVKENPQHGVNREYTIGNATDLVGTLSSTIRRYQEAHPIWDLVDRIEERKKDSTYVYRWVELVEDKDQNRVEKHLQAIQHRLRRAHGFLVTESGMQAQPEYAYRPQDLAFLTVWSALNEILSLHFDDPPYSRNLSKRSGTYRFRFFDPKQEKIVLYWKIKDGEVAESNLEIPSGLENALRPSDKEGPIYPSGVDNHRISWLLHRVGTEEDVSRFNELRKLRNHLEEAHGDVTGAQHAQISDIHDITSLWDKILVS